jgi:hypothetical protein
VTVRVTTTSPKARQPVEIHIVVEDPDTRIDRECTGTDYGDNSEPFCGRPSVDCPAPERQPHGAWSPPPKYPDRVETDISHIYQAAGTYTVHFVYRSTQSCAATGNPYYSEGTATTTVTVGG